MRKLCFLASLVLAVALSGAANADTFYSGRVDADATSNLGATADPAGTRTFLSFGGMAYSNLNPQTGIVTAVGWTSISKMDSFGDPSLNAAAGGNTHNLVAVFALQGNFTGGPGVLSVNFAGPAGLGKVNVYDIPLLAGNVPYGNLPSLNGATLVGSFNLADNVQALLQGPPGGLATNNLTLASTALLNTAQTVTGIVDASGSATLLFDYTGGTYFDYSPAGYNVNPANPQLLVDLIEKLQNSAGLNAGNYNTTQFDTISMAFIGVNFVQGTDTYSPFAGGLGQGAAGVGIGDVVQQIQGNQAIPGSLVEEVPEPASMIIWGVLAAGGSAAGIIRRRRSKTVA